MKSITTVIAVVIISLLGISVSYASNLCDDTCSITISFPTGGSIAAIEPATITFGDGGLVDTVDTVTAYLSGDTIVLNAGESLEFGSSGSFDIGDMGNIDYTNISVITDGDVSMEATSGIGQIGSPQGGTLSIKADRHTSITGSSIIISDWDIESEFITIESTGDIVVVGEDSVSNEPVNCEISALSGSNSSLTISNGLMIDSTDSCDTINSTITATTIQTDGSLEIIAPESSAIETPLDLSEQTTSSTNNAKNNDGGGSLCLGLILLVLGIRVAYAFIISFPDSKLIHS